MQNLNILSAKPILQKQQVETFRGMSHVYRG
jgi:hypothetical protein